jgi:thiol-disulfide isomerase/thioredoxin
MWLFIALRRTFTTETEHSFRRELLTTPAFLLMYTPHCSFCKALLPIWSDLGDRYENESSVIIAQVDCSLYDDICARFASSRGLPSLYTIKKGRTQVIRPERSMNAFVKIVEELKSTASSIQCARYPAEYDSTFPFFVFRSNNLSDEEVCTNLLRILSILPESQDRLYYESPAPNTSYIAHLTDSVSVEYFGRYTYSEMIRFTKDYLMTPFGYWRVDDGPISTRRFVFVVHEGGGVLQSFLPIAVARIREVVVGSLRYDDFRAVEPNVTFQTPAVFILNVRKSRFAIAEKVTSARFEELLDLVLRGRLEADARTRLPNLFPRLSDPLGSESEEVRLPRRIGKWVGIAIVLVVVFGIVIRRARVRKVE